MRTSTVVHRPKGPFRRPHAEPVEVETREGPRNPPLAIRVRYAGPLQDHSSIVRRAVPSASLAHGRIVCARPCSNGQDAHASPTSQLQMAPWPHGPVSGPLSRTCWMAVQAHPAVQCFPPLGFSGVGGGTAERWEVAGLRAGLRALPVRVLRGTVLRGTVLRGPVLCEPCAVGHCAAGLAHSLGPLVPFHSARPSSAVCLAAGRP